MIRKTAVATALSIGGVILAGGAAVGANIGILNAADNNSLGELSAQAPIVAPSSEPMLLRSSTAETDPSSDSAQSFTVDVAGTVEVVSDDVGVHLGVVQTNESWLWTHAASEPGAVAITFTSATDTLEFTATANGDGTISANVVRPVGPAVAAQSSAYYDDDDHEYGEHEEYEDDEHDEYEHDEYEHEGAEDDD